jgi:hypothetical protein
VISTVFQVSFREDKMMIRKSVLMLAMSLAVLVGSSATASAQKVSGGGINLFGDTFGFNAKVLPDGSTRGQAQFILRFSPDNTVRLHVDIDCLHVSGNKASMSGVVTDSNDPTAVGRSLFFAVIDNGQGGTSSPDETFGPFADLPFDCDVGVPPDEFFVPIASGNIKVKP